MIFSNRMNLYYGSKPVMVLFEQKTFISLIFNFPICIYMKFRFPMVLYYETRFLSINYDRTLNKMSRCCTHK